MPHTPPPLRLRPTFARLAAGWLLAFWCAVAAAAGADDIRRFDVPAGAGVNTLKRAAQQAGAEIVYSPAVVKGVRTQAVRGEFRVSEALDRMVAATPLRIVRDPATGIFSVVRRPSDPPPSDPPSASPAPTPPTTMKSKTPLATLGAWLALAFASPLSAQTSGAPGAAAGAEAGSISGRVQNVDTGQYLNNARVVVRGTDRAVFTDETGTFRLAGVPAGPAVLEVSYTGLDPQEVRQDFPQLLHRDRQQQVASSDQ